MLIEKILTIDLPSASQVTRSNDWSMYVKKRLIWEGKGFSLTLTESYNGENFGIMYHIVNANNHVCDMGPVETINEFMGIWHSFIARLHVYDRT